jgi:DNA-directed RNA polymerase specialized sigma24 family protein
MAIEDEVLRRILVEGLIARLAPRQRLAAECRWVMELTEAETARHMGCSMGAVKATLYLARRRLGPKLRESR